MLEAYDLSYIYQDSSEDYWILLKGTINGIPHLIDMIEYIDDKGFDKKRIFVMGYEDRYTEHRITSSVQPYLNVVGYEEDKDGGNTGELVV